MKESRCVSSAGSVGVSYKTKEYIGVCKTESGGGAGVPFKSSLKEVGLAREETTYKNSELLKMVGAESKKA